MDGEDRQRGGGMCRRPWLGDQVKEREGRAMAVGPSAPPGSREVEVEQVRRRDQMKSVLNTWFEARASGEWPGLETRLGRPGGRGSVSGRVRSGCRPWQPVPVCLCGRLEDSVFPDLCSPFISFRPCSSCVRRCPPCSWRRTGAE